MLQPATPPRFRLGIVTGLRDEAAIAENAVEAALEATAARGRDGVDVACLGPGSDAAATVARTLIECGARALLSFGYAGGCDPALPAGTAIIATGIRPPGGEMLWCNREWRRRLHGLLLGNVLLEEGAIYGADAPVASARAKQELFWGAGTSAVDMESAAVAGVAAAGGIPFLALRVIVDAADLTLPPTALAGVTAEGSTAPRAVLGSLLHRPQDLPGLARLGLAHREAARALARAAAAAAPLFGAI